MSAYYKVNFEIASNEDLRETFTLTDPAGNAIDLTGADLRMGIATAEADPLSASLAVTMANGGIVVPTPTLGQFSLAVPVTTLQALPIGIYRHDLIFVKSGQVRRIWSGTLSICQGIAS